MRIASGELVHLTVPSVAGSLGDLDLVYVPISDLPPLRSGLVWRRRNRDPRLREFIRLAREALRRNRIPAQARSRDSAGEGRAKQDRQVLGKPPA